MEDVIVYDREEERKEAYVEEVKGLF